MIKCDEISEFSVVVFNLIIPFHPYSDIDDDLFEALSDFGLSKLYDVMKNNSITAQNIWHVGDDQLKEWNVPINDILDYKRAKTEYEGKFDQTINVDLSLSF